jgi:hypothetical protein
MPHPSEYHIVVRRPVQRLIPASLVLLGMLSLPLLLVSISPAQTNGVTSGTTHAVGIPNSNASANARIPTSSKTPPPTAPTRSVPQPQPRPLTGGFYYPYVYAVPVPYPVNVDDNGAPGDNDPDYQGGPTIFDRRGAGPYSYIPPSSESPAESNAEELSAQYPSAADSSPDPEPPPLPTTLIFKDGHQLEIENYAIVNQTLYDLTPGHPRKIALADLDLPATQKQNDDRGVPFDLPPQAQAN